MTTRTITRRKASGLCANPHPDRPRCRNKARAGRTDCNTCHNRKQDEKSPLRRLYRNLKASATRRGKPFEIPFPCFELWAAMNGFNGGLSIDRIVPFVGYLVGNIQPLTVAENSRKQFTDKQLYADPF
jgi:hypothetical protein